MLKPFLLYYIGSKNGISKTGAYDEEKRIFPDGSPGRRCQARGCIRWAPRNGGGAKPEWVEPSGCRRVPRRKIHPTVIPAKGLPSSSPPEASFPQRMNRIWAIISPRVPLSFRAPALDRFLPSVRQPPGQEQPLLVSGSFPPETPRADHRVFRFGKPPCPFQRFPVPAERAIPDREGEVFRGLFRRPGRSSLIPQKKWHR